MSNQGLSSAMVRAGLAALAVVSVAGTASAIRSTPSAININTLVGANTYYGMGYTGTRSVMANVEAGHVWNGHETLGHVTTFFNAAPGLNQEQSGEFDRHATWVGHMMGGRFSGVGNPSTQTGIAHGGQLWSGTIATRWSGVAYATGFNFNNATLAAGYDGPILTGVNGRTSDVINSSWGGGTTSGADTHGFYTDYLMNLTGKTFVVSAGNSGPNPDTVRSPGAAWNNITVGSLGAEGDAIPYNTVSNFSSRGLSRFFNPQTGVGINGVRASVDIVAPGQDLVGAFYGGQTGGNAPFGQVAGPNSPGASLYSFGIAGTSFSSPIVAGGAALIVDAAYDKYAADGQSRDGRVVKAILQNSARKIPGWNNQQNNIGGVITTTQSLDAASGAGAMDLTQAFTQQTAGTTNVPGLGGGMVQRIGWDYGNVASGAPNDYAINVPLIAGSLFTVSLNWFADATDNLNAGGSVRSVDDLQLQVFEDPAIGADIKVAESISLYNNVEHLNFTVPRAGNYYIRVLWNGELFDIDGDANNEFYGLAWHTVPTPGGMMLMLVGGLAAARRRRH
ncbi:MAG TPA: hypothetical protein DEB06_06065 [Phycisphaerales bacterium]|nr:hypothetical protein [Phycisphaerales bacterium]